MTTLRPCRKVDAATMQSMMSREYQKGNRVPELSQKLFDRGFPLRIVEHCQLDGCIAELHLHEDDFWVCLEGEAEFILGGRLVYPRYHDGLTWIADSIEGGEHYSFRAGDWFHVPAGQAHQPITSGQARLIIVKIPAKEGRVVLDYLSDKK